MKENFRSKLIIAGGFLMLFSIMGAVNNCFSVTIIPITEYFEVPRASYALSQTLLFLFNAVFSAVSYRIYQRFDIVKCARAAAVISCATLFAMSYAPGLWVFYIGYAILGFCMGMASQIPMSILINEWFTDSANSYIGLCMMGSGVGGALFNPLMNNLIGSLGWQSAYKIVALISGVLSISASFLMLKRSPDASSKEAGASSAGGKQGKKDTDAPGLMQPRMLGFALMIIVLYCCGNALNSSLIPHLQDKGVSPAAVSVCSSVMMVVLAVGKFIYGKIVDKKGIKPGIRISIAALSISMFALAFMRRPFFIFISLGLLGMLLGCPFGTVGLSAAAKEIGGEKRRTATMGIMSTAGTAGSVVMPMILGKAYDMTGSYSPIYLVLSAFSLAVLLLSGVIYKTKLREDQQP